MNMISKRPARPSRPTRGIAPAGAKSPAAAGQQAMMGVRPIAPMAPAVSTKPSDTPMRRASVIASRKAGTVPVAKVPALPSMNPKPVSSQSKSKRPVRPKTGTK